MKKLMLFGALLGAFAATAMPTKAELQKAQPLLEELMADDMSALKNKKKPPAQVGEDALKFVEEAESEATKFLLYKGAVTFFARGGEYERAADAVVALRANIADVPPDVVAEIISTAARGASAKQAPRLMSLYRAARAQAKASKTVETARAALAKKPGDAKLRQTLAEALVLAGDWKSALEEFSKLDNAAGKAAKAEQEGINLQAAADFWWDYTPGLKDEADAFQTHAATLYRTALDEGSITGLKKTLAEKRVKQFEASCVPVKASSVSQPIELAFSEIEKMTFIHCPAGSAMVGASSKSIPLKKRKAVITRPFWMTESLVTVGQYCELSPEWDKYVERFGFSSVDIKKISNRFGGDDAAVSHLKNAEITAFCEKIQKKLERKIPDGYVVRLPTDAEWAYAFSCGGKVKQTDYAKLNEGRPTDAFKDIGVDLSIYSSEGLKGLDLSHKGYKDGWDLGANLPRYKVKTCKPNDWGFYDMAGLCWERLLDTVPALPKGISPWDSRAHKIFRLKYDNLVGGGLRDPLLMAEGDGVLHVQLLITPEGGWHRWTLETCGWDVGFRLVIGPDLEAEKKVKAAK